MQKRILTLILLLLSIGTIPAFADMGVEGVILWIVIFSGIIIAFTVGIIKALFWAASKSKSDQKQPHTPYRIIYADLIIIAGTGLVFLFYVFVCLFLTIC